MGRQKYEKKKRAFTLFAEIEREALIKDGKVPQQKHEIIDLNKKRRRRRRREAMEMG